MKKYTLLFCLSLGTLANIYAMETPIETSTLSSHLSSLNSSTGNQDLPLIESAWKSAYDLDIMRTGALFFQALEVDSIDPFNFLLFQLDKKGPFLEFLDIQMKAQILEYLSVLADVKSPTKPTNPNSQIIFNLKYAPFADISFSSFPKRAEFQKNVSSKIVDLMLSPILYKDFQYTDIAYAFNHYPYAYYKHTLTTWVADAPKAAHEKILMSISPRAVPDHKAKSVEEILKENPSKTLTQFIEISGNELKLHCMNFSNRIILIGLLEEIKNPAFLVISLFKDYQELGKHSDTLTEGTGELSQRAHKKLGIYKPDTHWITFFENYAINDLNQGLVRRKDIAHGLNKLLAQSTDMVTPPLPMNIEESVNLLLRSNLDKSEMNNLAFSVLLAVLGSFDEKAFNTILDKVTPPTINSSNPTNISTDELVKGLSNLSI